MKAFRYFLLVIMTAAILFSCQKDQPGDEPDAMLINQVIKADEMLLGIDHMLVGLLDFRPMVLKSGLTENQILSKGCPVITITKSMTPWEVTIDFGQGCTISDSVLYSGKIFVTGSFSASNQLNLSLKVVEFGTGGYKFSGDINKVITLDEQLLSGVATLDEEVVIKLPGNQGEIRHKAKLTCRYNAGNAATFEDDTILLWGKLTSRFADGYEIIRTAQENNPLLFSVSCRQFVSGVASFKSNKNQTWSIDYGEGACDNTALYTFGNETKTITF